MEHDSTHRGWNLIAPRMKLARESTGIARRVFLSQDALVEKLPYQLNFTRETVSKIETRTRSVRDFELVEIARALDVDIEWLLGLSDKGGLQ